MVGSTSNRLQTGRSLMGFMNVYFVLVVLPHALPTGGIRRSSLDQRLCSMLIDGYLTGNFSTSS